MRRVSVHGVRLTDHEINKALVAAKRGGKGKRKGVRKAARAAATKVEVQP